MTQTAKTQEERLAQAIASIEERDGYCLVASESESGKHVVTYNENFYATYCTCVGHSQYGTDCYHMHAVDRHFDDRRPDFYTMHGIQKLVKQEITSPAQAEDENEVVSVQVGNVTVSSSRKHIANAVAHTKWSQEMAAYARAKDAERATPAAKLVAQYREDGSLHTVVCIDGQFADTTTDAEVVAAVEGGKVETRYFEQKRALDEQYSKAPSAWELSETQASEMRAFYNGL